MKITFKLKAQRKIRAYAFTNLSALSLGLKRYAMVEQFFKMF